jgi:O-antigen/teichoic acid export membrane protein
VKLAYRNCFRSVFNNLKWNGSSIVFIVLNIFVAGIGFVRSFYLGIILNLEQLGYITLIHTGATIIGFLQFGLLSGGFRILSNDKVYKFEVVNNTVLTYLSLLFMVLFIGYPILLVFKIFEQRDLVGLSILLGFSSLVVNWVTAVQFSKNEFMKQNFFSISSSTLSLLFLVFFAGSNLYLASLAILLQPIFSLVLSYGYLRNFRFSFNLDILKVIFKIGFVTYLTTLLGLVSIQIERWSINFYLGTETLGQLYLLFILFATWNLIPLSLGNLFFPSNSRAFDEENIEVYLSGIKRNLYYLIGYALTMSLIVVFMTKPLTAFMFKEHLPYINYIFWALPGLVFRTISEGFYMFLTTAVKLKQILFGDVTSLLFYCLCLVCTFCLDAISVLSFIICYNLYSFFRFIILYIAFTIEMRKLSSKNVIV